MRALYNVSKFEQRIPGVSGRFDAGSGKTVGDGPGQVPADIAERFEAYPGWEMRGEVTPGTTPPAGGVNASKGALTAAEAAGLDLSAISITGTGKDGQITKPDVDAFIAAQKAAAKAGTGDDAPAGN